MPYTVVFRLKRPQPSLLLMLASGYTPDLRGPLRILARLTCPSGSSGSTK